MHFCTAPYPHTGELRCSSSKVLALCESTPWAHKGGVINPYGFHTHRLEDLGCSECRVWLDKLMEKGRLEERPEGSGEWYVQWTAAERHAALDAVVGAEYLKEKAKTK